MNAPSFSIVIPVFNVADCLGECLDALFAQTYQDWEALCVDDGSPDDSGAILDEYARRDSRIRVKHKENGGTGPARNDGVAMATGEWIVFLDPDDVLGPHALEEIHKAAIAHPAQDFVRYRYTAFEQEFTEQCVEGQTVVDVSRVVTWESLYAYLWEFAMRRNVVEGILAPNYRRGQDRCYLLSVMMQRMTSYLYLNSFLYGYRQRPGSSVNKRASVPIMKDELSHRLFCIGVIDASAKRVDYADSGWLEEFCVRGYLNNSEDKDKYSSEEQEALVEWFYLELPALCAVKGFSVFGKLSLWLYAQNKSYGWRKMIRSDVPTFFRRVRKLILHPAEAISKMMGRSCPRGKCCHAG